MHQMTRRFALALLFGVPVMALAHGGHSTAKIRATAKVLKNRNRVVTLELTVLNTASTALILEDVSVAGAEVLSTKGAAKAAGFDVIEMVVRLRFSNDVPDEFTVVLDFGEQGQAHVSASP